MSRKNAPRARRTRNPSPSQDPPKLEANSPRVLQLLDRIEQNYDLLAGQLEELEQLVPETLERVESAGPNKPR